MVGAAYINGGPPLSCQIIIDHQVEMVTSLGSKPDPNWSFTDAAGHFHAYDQTPGMDYPTLRRRIEVVPCYEPDHGEDCDGASITHLHCVICDEEIEPGLISGPHTEGLPGRTSWSAKVTMPPDEAFGLPEVVSLCAEFGNHGTVFGLAAVEATTVSGDRATVELVGTTPLGRTRNPNAPTLPVVGAARPPAQR